MWRALIPALMLGCGFTAPSEVRVRRSVEHVSVGTQLVRSPEDLSSLEATFLQTNPTIMGGTLRIPAEHRDATSWSAVLDGPLPLQFFLPDYPMPIARILDLPQLDVTTLFFVLEHPQPQLAPSAATFLLNVGLDHPVAAGETFAMYTVGSWNYAPVPATTGATMLGTTIQHAAMASLSGRPHEAITREDAAFVLRASNNVLTGLFAAAPFDQTGTDTLAGAMVPVVADQMLDTSLDRDAAATRLLGASPAVGNVTTTWSVTAAPGATIASSSGPILAAGTLAAGTKILNAPYGNPFATRNWPATLFWQASGNRTVMTSTLPVTAFAGIYEYSLAAAGGSSTLAAGLPQALTFGGTPLSTDNQVFPLPTQPVEVEFLTDRPDSSTLYSLSLYELIPNVQNTALTYRPVVSLTALEPRFMLPADLFNPDKLYILRAGATAGGYEPGALARGALNARALPFAAGYLDGGVFQIR